MANERIESLSSQFPKSKDRLQFYVNEDFKDLSEFDPKSTLLRYLRDNGYTGTKYGCGEGGCGACCVVLAEYNPKSNQVRYRTVNSCLMPLCAAYGKQIITVEGLGCPDKPHPIQERFAKGNASQCGFCTPGFVMSLYGLLKINPDPSISDIEEAFDGNLCRCTGYRSILESARSFVKKNVYENSCKDLSKRQVVDFDQFKDYDPKNDPEFPAQLTKFQLNSTVFLSNGSTIWFRPSNLDELLTAKDKWQDAKLIGGNSEVGVEMNLRPLNQPNVFIYIGDLNELRDVQVTGDNLEVGVNITLTELINSINRLKKTSKVHHISLFNAFLSNLRFFASRHIRNFATLAGNITTGSPISDLNPILVATDAILTVASKKRGQRVIKMREFFLAYRKVNLNPDEVILKVVIPLPMSKQEQVFAYKQAKRKVDDIALVNGCYKVKLDETYRIEQLDISLGGMSAKTIYLSKLNEISKNLIWGDPNTLKQLKNSILDEVKIEYSAPGAHPTYRRALVVSFLTRFWYQTIKVLGLSNNNLDKTLENIDEIERKISSSSHDVFSSHHEPHLGATSPHVASLLHTTGFATYVDDIPKQAGELYAWPVLSTKAHANILKVDESKALAVKGVYAFITYKDVPNSNIWGIGQDEEYFASSKVLFHGQLIGLVVAENASLAKLGSNLVEITYEELKPILTIEDAVAADSFYSFKRTITKGNIDENTFKTTGDDNTEDLVHEGTFEMGGQEHFYLETNGCLIIPKRESNELEINSSTQNPTEIQECASHTLGIPQNKITSKCKRLGGGFGGKETRANAIIIPCTVAAYKLNRPIRCSLDRDVDMILTGKRHPIKAWYKVRVSRDGMFKAYEVTVISNAGCSLDLSGSVTEQALSSLDGVYHFPNIQVTGKVAKTNVASNTAFRAFGRPQGLAITESMLAEVAEKLGIDAAKIRRQNMLKENDKCLVNMELKDWYVPEMFDQVSKNFDYTNVRKAIESFNEQNVWKKRGMAIVPMKYGIAFGLGFMNQGGILVHIYLDGTVLINTPGIEMGQGLYTKLVHIAANSLQIAESQITVGEASTNTVP